MNRRVRQSISLALLTLVSLFGGCSDGAGKFAAQRKPRLVLGVSQLMAEASWNAANTESIRNAARDVGIDLRVEYAHRSQQKQIKALRSFIANASNVIAFSPVVETGWETVLREAKAAKIPVILTDRAVEVSDDSLFVSLIGSDFRRGRPARRPLAARNTPRAPRATSTSSNCRGQWARRPPTIARKDSPKSLRPIRATRSSVRRPATSRAPRARKSWRRS